MHRHIDLHTRTRPYRITRSPYGWFIWDRRRHIGTNAMGDLPGPAWAPVTWMYPTHAAAVAALDAHLREQAAKEDS